MRRRDFLGIAGLAAVGAARPAGLAARGARRRLQQDARFDAVARLIETKMAEYRVPGVAFGLLKNGAATTRGFGLTNLDNPQPVTPETVFPIASISKTVATTAILRLVEQGRVELRAPVRTYIPDFRVQDEEASRTVSVWHLLTHTPGWEGQLGTPDRGSETGANFVAGLRDNPQLAPPGVVWSYNNAGFGVAGRILEVVTGRSIHDALADLVFEPLGLERAFTETGEAMTHRFAAGHRERSEGTEVIHSFRLPVNSAVGGAAMSVSDLLAYARFHLGDGTADGTHVLERASLELMRTPQLRKEPTTDEIGVGWHLRRVGGVLTAAHGGTLGGHCLHVQLVAERDLAFAILTNHSGGWRLIQDVQAELLRSYEGVALAPGQATGGNRGGNEDMTAHAEPLDRQPPLDEYVGTYRRPPVGELEVRAEGGRLVATGSGFGQEGAGLVFWGPDLTYIAPPRGNAGVPVEFVRNDAGDVAWIRVNGRIARKDR